jgi:UDP-N-acetylmuramoylalanine--D-glutamate ligase
MREFRDTRVLVLGLAREGVALARYLNRQGAAVIATDNAERTALQGQLSGLDESRLRILLGGDHPELLSEVDAMFVSPGVPENNSVYVEARRRGIPVESMTTLFFELCPGPIVGITGSSGKTTTTGLIGHMAQEAGMDTVVGGNIGEPMIDLLPAVGPDTTVLLELSSFQLSLLRCSPHVAVITNISPNHLDRHGTMNAYIDAKRHIVAHQTACDFAVLNACDPQRDTFAHATPAHLRWFGERSTCGARVERGTITLVRDDVSTDVLLVEEIPLLGSHNVENVLAAVTSADVVGIPVESMRAAIRSFRPAAHRLETVAQIGGVFYVDDSIATTPARARVGLQAIATTILLIAGGRDKRLPWEEFARSVVERVRVLLLIGEAAQQIEEAVLEAMNDSTGMLRQRDIVRCDSLDDAVAQAGRLARPGETVLLSPACTSYDMFSNYEERGRAFARAAGELHAA